MAGSAFSKVPRQRVGNGDLVVQSLLKMAGDWDGLRGALMQYDGDELSALLSGFSSNAHGAYFWLRKEPRLDLDDPMTRLILGAVTVSHAWHVRTDAQPQGVSRKKFAAFFTLLGEAEGHLRQAIALDESWAAPWSVLVTSGRGLQVGVEEITYRFENAVARCPGHLTAHEQMLQALCRKWAGSHEQMHAFAAAAANGTHRATLAHLVAVAHIELWFDLRSVLARHRYIRQQAVRDSLASAAEASIFRPDYHVPAGAPYNAANHFAMAFSLAGMPREAKRAFALTEGVVTKVPWGYIDGRFPTPIYLLRQTRAALALGR